VTIKRRKRPYNRRPGRASPYDKSNAIIGSTSTWKIGEVFSTAADITALQNAGFPATELRRRAAAEEYFNLHRAELRKQHGKRDAALSAVASRFHIDSEIFIGWMHRSRRAR